MVNDIKLFLIFCSGADKEILKDCPDSESTKYASVGATIFFTGLLASFSGGYALYTIFQDISGAWLIAIFFSAIWGLMIFNLDRYIVSSMRKKEKFIDEFKLAIPRIFIALIIAVVVSKPIEVRIFNSAIETALDSAHKDAALANAVFADKLNHQSEFSNSFSEHIDKENKLQEQLGSDPTSEEFRDLKDKRDIAQTNYNKIQKNNSELIRQEYDKIQYIKDNKSITVSENGVAKRYLPPEAQNSINGIKGIISNLNSEINFSRNSYEKLRDKIDFIRDSVNNDIKSRLYQNKIEKDSIGRIKTKVDSVAEFISDSLNLLSKKHGTDVFINQVQILGVITDKWFSTFWWTSWLITLLFLTIELAPLIVKLLSDKGPYDEKLETNKKKIENYEKAYRRINETIAENDYYSNTLLIERLEINKKTSKQASEKVIDTITNKINDNKKFDEAIEDLNQVTSSIPDETKKKGRKSYINDAIDYYDTVSNYLIKSIRVFFKDS